METDGLDQTLDAQVVQMDALSLSIAKDLSPIVAQAQTLAAAVKDRPTYDAAIAHGRLLKTKEKWAEEMLDPFCKFFKGLHAKAVAERDGRMKPCQEGQVIIGRATAKWEAEQNRIRAEQERILQAEARKRDEDARLAAAEAAEKMGDKKAAEQILNMPTVTPLIELPSLPTEGKSNRTTWNAECHDLMALVKAVAEGKAPIRFIQANMVELNKEAKNRKEAMNGSEPIPGVRAISDTKNNFKGLAA